MRINELIAIRVSSYCVISVPRDLWLERNTKIPYDSYIHFFTGTIKFSLSEYTSVCNLVAVLTKLKAENRI